MLSQRGRRSEFVDRRRRQRARRQHRAILLLRQRDAAIGRKPRGPKYFPVRLVRQRAALPLRESRRQAILHRGQRGAGCGNFLFLGTRLRFQFRRGQSQVGLVIAAAVARTAVAGFVHVIEESVQTVEFARGQRIVLMVVAARAPDRQTQPDGTEGAHAVHQVLGLELLGDAAGFGIDAMIALEAGGDLLVERGAGQQVAGDLFHGELVVRQVAVEGVDHPIAPRPHLLFRVHLVAVGVGVSSGVEPVDGHALAVVAARRAGGPPPSRRRRRSGRPGRHRVRRAWAADR